MKRLAVVLILLLVCAMPVSARTCRNGRMTVYHHENYRPYPNNHLYNNNNYLYPINHQYSNNQASKPKPVYAYNVSGSRPLHSGSSSGVKAGYMTQ